MLSAAERVAVEFGAVAEPGVAATSLPAAVAALLAWAVAPLAIAFVLFTRRDIESGAG